MQWSDQHHLACFNEFVLISLTPVPGILQATGLVLLKMESWLQPFSFFPLVLVLVSAKQLRNVHQTLLSMSFREERKVLWLCYVAHLLSELLLVSRLNNYILFLHIHIFLIINSWSFATQRRCKAKPFASRDKEHCGGGAHIAKGSQRVLLGVTIIDFLPKVRREVIWWWKRQ